MIVSFVDDVDLADRGKRIAAVGLVAAGATIVRIRDGGVAGTIKWEFNFAAAGSVNFAWPSPIYIAKPFVEVTVNLTSGYIDIL